jgi:RNA polymerase sigma-70 factor (ECF subfamily)
VLLHGRAGDLLSAGRQAELLRSASNERAAGAQRMRLPVAMPLVAETPVMRSQIDWSAFYERLHAFVAARIRNGADVDDLVQRILERAMSKAPNAEIDSTAGWLFGIARNSIADHYREQARTLNAEADILDAADPMGSSEDERAAVLACMKPLLDSLPHATAQLLQWADMDGRTMQSIAGELGISLTAAKSRVQRARKDFVKVTSDCCAITIDARGRVTELTPKERTRAGECPPCTSNCSSDDRKTS